MAPVTAAYAAPGGVMGKTPFIRRTATANETFQVQLSPLSYLLTVQ